MDRLLSHATVVTMNPNRDIIEDGAVYVKDDRIQDVGVTTDLQQKYSHAEVLDCTGQVIIPGLINTHTHLFQTLLKGLGDDRVLKDWFTTMTGPSAVELTPDDCYAAALHGCVESIQSGVTTLVDFMYVHPQENLTEAVIRAFEEAGIRGVVARGYITTGVEVGVPKPLVEDVDAALADARRLIRKYNKPGARVQVGLAPCMIWTVDRDTLEKTRKLADEEGALITMHVSETPFEIENSLQRFGMRDLPYLEHVGFLGPDVLAVHCVQCDDRDIRILKLRDVKVSHNPCSNMYLASGFAPIPQMLLAGVTVGLATDGPASNNNHNLIHSLKFAALIHKGYHRDATIITAEKVLEMATIDGARAIGLQDELGSIEPGKKADLVVLRFDNTFATPLHNPVSALVYSALGNEPELVIIDGQIVMRERTMQPVSESRVMQLAQEAADGLAERAGTVRFKRRPWRSLAV
jgi:5-methylthioadenosine/S-adenosylhomocysteine deaminase